MANEPTPAERIRRDRHNAARRDRRARARNWKREMDALTPAERAAWEQLPYSTIPEPGHARDVVAAVKPIIAAATAHHLASILDDWTYTDAANLLRRIADGDFEEPDRG